MDGFSFSVKKECFFMPTTCFTQARITLICFQYATYRNVLPVPNHLFHLLPQKDCRDSQIIPASVSHEERDYITNQMM
jgi:hypothetical protein